MRETGVGIYEPLFFIGVVENNVDERLEGRVQVRAFGVHGTNQQVPTASLPWATLIHGSYDPNAPVPPVNSFVFGFFIDGRDAQQPMIIGLIPTQMTELIDPEVTGWGAIPERDARILARGSRPNDLGQPANSLLARGENIESTYVLQQAMNRVSGIEVAAVNPDSGERETFSEPAPAYGAEYPYNRVIQTANHSIELDDTPGAERITIYHSSGSYVAIDTRGTSVYKSVSDSYDINDRNQNVYIGGRNIVTVMGDSQVYVKGNKIEEIEGDLIQNVRGNHLLSVAGQMNLNAGVEVQMRSAKLRLEGNVEGVNIKSARDVRIQSGQSIHVKSGVALFLESTNSTNIKAGDNVFIEADGTGNIKATQVNIDDIVSMANGDASGSSSATPAEGTELPEPVSASVSARTPPETGDSLGHAGYTSLDEPGENTEETQERRLSGNEVLTNAQVDQILTGPEPDQARAQAEAFLGRPLSDTEWNNLVAATVAESLPNSPEEQAAIMAVILNRVRSDRYPNTVTEVLLQPNQFQAVTGTRVNPGPSSNFVNPNERQMASTVRGANQYLGTMDPNWLNFTSDITAAYGPGTNLGFRDDVRTASGSRVIGGTVFGTVT